MRRKQYDALKKLVLTGPEWCDILGVLMISPDGWANDMLSAREEFKKPCSLSDFVARAFPSAIQMEEGSLDLNDCENFVAQDQMDAPQENVL